MKIILPDLRTVSEGDLDLSILEDFGEVIKYPLSKTEELQERLSDADIILCNKTLLNEQTLKMASHLKFIGLFATGYNNVDLEYTNKMGITVSNAGSYSTGAVAQHTFALILNHFNKISKYDEYVKAGKWKTCETFLSFEYTMGELNNKILGIIGFGSIGKSVANIALAFNMKVIVYSRNKEKVLSYISTLKTHNISYGDIDEITKHSDVISIHCPLNSKSEKMVNSSFLSKMKKNAYLINTSRGGVINEEDLYEYLNEEKIAGAALDVLSTEPMAKDCILFNAKNITITPHVAWAPLETRQRLLDIIYDNLKCFLEGKPKNVVKK